MLVQTNFLYVLRVKQESIILKCRSQVKKQYRTSMRIIVTRLSYFQWEYNKTLHI